MVAAIQPQLGVIELRNVIEAMSSGVFLFDRGGKLLHANREALRIFGFRSFEEAKHEFAIGICIVRVTNVDGTPIPGCRLRRALDGEDVSEELERVEPIDGRWHAILRVSIRPIRDDEGNIVGAVKQV